MTGTFTHPDLILDTAARRLLAALGRPAPPPGLRQQLRTLAGMAGENQLPWAERAKLLAEHLLPVLPVLLLDNFEDHQAGPTGGGPPEVRAPHLAAFLTSW